MTMYIIRMLLLPSSTKIYVVARDRTYGKENGIYHSQSTKLHIAHNDDDDYGFCFDNDDRLPIETGQYYFVTIK